MCDRRVTVMEAARIFWRWENDRVAVHCFASLATAEDDDPVVAGVEASRLTTCEETGELQIESELLSSLRVHDWKRAKQAVLRETERGTLLELYYGEDEENVVCIADYDCTEDVVTLQAAMRAPLPDWEEVAQG